MTTKLEKVQPNSHNEEVLRILLNMNDPKWVEEHQPGNTRMRGFDGSVVQMFTYSAPIHPIVRIYPPEGVEWIELCYEVGDVEISHFDMNDENPHLPLDLTEEQFFQKSLVLDMAWLTYEMYYHATSAALAHVEYYKR